MIRYLVFCINEIRATCATRSYKVLRGSANDSASGLSLSGERSCGFGEVGGGGGGFGGGLSLSPLPAFHFPPSAERKKREEETENTNMRARRRRKQPVANLRQRWDLGLNKWSEIMIQTAASVSWPPSKSILRSCPSSIYIHLPLPAFCRPIYTGRITARAQL